MSQPFQFWPFLRPQTVPVPTPYSGPWPRPGARPNSPEAYFTSPDSRMRPVQSILQYPPRYYAENTGRLTVTPFNFPHLYLLFHQLLQEAGAPQDYSLVILERLPVRGYSSDDGHGHHAIAISLDQINRNDFDSIRFLLGHEIGHIWQRQHPAGLVAIRESRVDRQHTYESEADIFARCLSGDSPSILRGMRIMGGGASGDGSHAPIELRMNAVRNMQARDCDFFQLPVPVPLRHRPFVAQREP